MRTGGDVPVFTKTGKSDANNLLHRGIPTVSGVTIPCDPVFSISVDDSSSSNAFQYLLSLNFLHHE